MPPTHPHPIIPIHFVGSLPLPSPNKVFTHLPSSLPLNTLKRLPDGEPGVRNNFTGWQWGVFAEQGLAPALTNVGDNVAASQRRDWSPEEIEGVMREVPMVLETGYDIAALASYPLFQRAKLASSVPQATKFQVSIPTPTNFLPFGVLPAFQRAVEPRYAAGLAQAIRRVQAVVAHAELAVQLDLAVEFALLGGGWYDGVLDAQQLVRMREGGDVGGEEMMDALVDKIVKLASVVDVDVELGFHCCYGDAGGKHFLEPPDTGMIAAVLLRVLDKLERPVAWIHFPVPKGREDEAYLLPLEPLLEKLDEGIDVFVGLVHAGDLEGTRRSMEVVRKVFGGRGFGVATECGSGRKSEGEFESILEIMREVCGG